MEYEYTPKPLRGIRFEFDRFMLEPWQYGGLSIHQVGELCCHAGYEIPEHPQWCHEISYIVSGNAVFANDGAAYALKAGDLFLSPEGMRHSIRATGQIPLRFVYLGFDIADTLTGEAFASLRGFFVRTREYLFPSMQKLQPIFSMLIDEFYTDRANELMIYSAALQLLVLTQEFSSRKEKSVHPAQQAENAIGKLVFDIMGHVDDRIFQAITIREMARHLGYSECYLSHAFKEKTGQTLQGYIIQEKVAKAIELFRLGNYSVTAVAEKLGYATVQSFSRAFRRVVGCPPSRYLESISG